jgi:hypothetical protein
MTQLSPATLAVVRCLARIVYEDFRAGQRAAVGKVRAHDSDIQKSDALDIDDLANIPKGITRQ